MKVKWVNFVIAGLISVAPLARAATNSLSAALQRGLFEEEANHNLDAAIQAYQAVINQYDQSHKLAATAVFRLGESYRKQGKTNEATAQYERVVREFSDQAPLVTLSQQNLAALGGPVQKPRDSAQAEAASPSTTSAEAEEVKRIQALIKDSPDLINATGPGGSGGPLLQAAAKGELTVAQFLLANGADLEAKNRRNGNLTPLHLAAENGHKAMVELLLDKGASMNSIDSSGYTPLHLAASHGFRSVVEVLLAHKADPNAKTAAGTTPLHLAVAEGLRPVAELLIAHGADVNAVSTSVGPPSGGEFRGTPLHVSAARGNEGLTALLLKHHADVKAVTRDGMTPLHVAAVDNAHLEVAKLLLAHGADVNARDRRSDGPGQTPLHLALDRHQREMVTLLLNNKADPNSRFDVYVPVKGVDGGGGRRVQSGNFLARGYTPLLFAIHNEDADLTEQLLTYKAEPNLRSDDGTTALLEALQATPPARTRMLTALLEHGAEVDARETGGQRRTPLLKAVDMQDKDTVQLLLAHKADANVQTENGWSPLHYAAGWARGGKDMTEIAALLLDAGADVNLQNKDGQTSLSMLSQASVVPGGSLQSQAKMAELLRQHGALEDLPRPKVIQLWLPANGYRDACFSKGTNDWNYFTLLELIGVEYALLSSSPQGQSRDHQNVGGLPQYEQLKHPDFSRVQIRRPAPDLKSWQERTVDFTPVIESGDCPGDVSLEWGDVVQIPEADHALSAHWPGLSTNELASLKKCLTRQVTVIVKGERKTISLAPDITFNYLAAPGQSLFRTHAPFWIKPALRESNLLLSSCDLSRVKVTRRDPQGGQKLEWTVDCSNPNYAPDLWLRDGDVIEVPDKS